MASGAMAAAFIVAAVISAGSAVYSAKQQKEAAAKLAKQKDLEPDPFLVDKTEADKAAELEELGGGEEAKKRKLTAKERFAAEQADVTVSTEAVGLTTGEDVVTKPKPKVTGVQLGD